jgi:hypothetical protein
MRHAKTIIIGALASIASHAASAAPIDSTVTAPPRAAFVCPETNSNLKPEELARIRNLLPTGNMLEYPAQLSASITELKRLGLSRAMIVDHLVGAYCPAIAQRGSLSDAQKTEDVRLYASRVTAYVYGEGHVDDIVMTVLLKPSDADRVNAAARKNGVSVEKWLSTAVESALKTR